MPLFRPTREPRPDDPWLPAKIALFAGGAGCGVAGMATGSSWLVWIGVVFLAAGLLLRFASNRTRVP